MIDIFKFYRLLLDEGVEFLTGVPDTILNDFCLNLDSYWLHNHHIIAANEGNAIALASGYHLASGTIPLVYMQNSGLGNAMNPLISLVSPTVYSIPMVLLIGWRGEPETNDWPQHQLQGEITPVLLDNLGIRYKVLSTDQKEVDMATRWAIRTAENLQSPTALLVKKGVLAEREKTDFTTLDQRYKLSRKEAIKTILATAPKNTIYVASTGRITRELNAIRDELAQTHSYDFLNIGAMGHSLSIATGIAIANPKKKVICLDGDAASIMHLGSLPVTGSLDLTNLTHIVLNNGAHESVGGQPTVCYGVNLNKLASAANFKTMSSHLETANEISNTILDCLKSDKPYFIEIRIRKGMAKETPLLICNPIERKLEMQKQLSSKV